MAKTNQFELTRLMPWEEHQLIVARYQNTLARERKRLEVYKQYKLPPEGELQLLCMDSQPVPEYKPVEKGMGYVYVIQSQKDLTCKIGHSRSFKNREKQFNVKLPFEWEPVMLFHSRAYKDEEKHFHSEFNGNKVRGEWFSLSPGLVLHIWRKIRAQRKYFGQFIAEDGTVYRNDLYNPKCEVTISAA